MIFVDMSDPRGAFLKAKLELEGVEPTPRWVFVSVVHQRLWAYEGDKCVMEMPCSTGIKPPSCAWGSHGTPLGLHKVAEKFGEGAAPGTVFEQRVSTGRIASPDEEKGLITSRILWLEGVEDGKNLGYECGSHNRKIYIHGTNREVHVGTRFSAGCVNLRNADVIKLFDWAREGDWVMID